MARTHNSIYAMAFLRTLASAISGFAIDVFVRLSGASDFTYSLVAAAPAVTYTIAALFLSGHADKLGRRTALMISSGATLIASISYAIIIVVVPGLPVIVIAVLCIGAGEGLLAGWFWPVLQASIGDKARSGDKTIRVYNLSWNLGLILGNGLVAAFAGVSANPRIIFPILLQALVGGIALNWGILLLIRAKLSTSRPGELEKSTLTLPAAPPVAVQVIRDSPAKVPFTVWLALVAVFGFTANMSGMLTNVFNQVTAISSFPLLVVNLLPWLPLIDSTRQMAQLTASGSYQVDKKAPGMIVHITFLMGILAALGAMASLSLTQGGIVVLLTVMGLHGVLSGILYNLTMAVVLTDTPAVKRSKFQGLYEAVSGVGLFAGPLLVGIISEVSGYYAAYAVVACISVFLALALAQLNVMARNPPHLVPETAQAISPPRAIPVQVYGVAGGLVVTLLAILAGNPVVVTLSAILLAGSTSSTIFANAWFLRHQTRSAQTLRRDRLKNWRQHAVPASMPSNQPDLYDDLPVVPWARPPC